MHKLQHSFCFFVGASLVALGVFIGAHVSTGMPLALLGLSIAAITAWTMYTARYQHDIQPAPIRIAENVKHNSHH